MVEEENSRYSILDIEVEKSAKEMRMENQQKDPSNGMRYTKKHRS